MEAYLDNSATTRVDAQVQELMKKLMDVDFGNPSSRHQKGVVAEGYIKEARQKIAATLKVDPKELIITFWRYGVQQYGTYWNGTCCKEKGKPYHYNSSRASKCQGNGFFFWRSRAFASHFFQLTAEDRFL